MVSLTVDDQRIMQGIRKRWKYPLDRWYRYYDGQDAELVLRAMAWRWIPELNVIRPEAFSMWSNSTPLQSIALGGDLSATWCRYA